MIEIAGIHPSAAYTRPHMAQPSHPGRLHCIRALLPEQSSQSQPTLCVPSHPPHPLR